MNKRNQLLSFLLTLCFLSCREQEGKYSEEDMLRLVTAWQGKELRFPKEMTALSYATDTVEHLRTMQAEHKVLVYVDSLGCTSCKLQLGRWKQLMAEVDSLSGGGVPFLFFFESDDVKEVRYMLKSDRFSYPIYLDRKGEFGDANEFPSDITFQTFLLDRDNRVVVIGNPIHNLKVKDLYLKELSAGTYQATTHAQTQLEASTMESDLGDVPLGGNKSQSVTLYNRGAETFHLKGVTTSCDCTTTAIEWKTIAAGDSATVMVHYEAEDATDDFFRTVHVHGNIPDEEIMLSFIGRVVKE